MLRAIYKPLTFLASLAIFPYFLLGTKRRKKLLQRYGCWNLAAEDCIWMHAASFGEVTAISPVIKLLREKYPSSKILITCTTGTGLEKAAEIADYCFLAPLDNSLWIKKAFRKVRFNSLIISETELWPNMIEFAVKRDVPLYLINARISDYTLNSYKKFKGLLTPLLNCFNRIICINEESEVRFRELGVYKDLTSIAGYSKYDISAPNNVDVKKSDYFDPALPLLTLASIRPGEESIWFPALKRAKESGMKFNLLIAPRHQEKFDYFQNKLKEYQITFNLYSSNDGLTGETLLLNTMGKLREFYTFSDAAFIGASLVDIGGHNPLEPVPSKCAVAIGPHYNNVRDVVNALRKVSGISLVETEDDAVTFIKNLTDIAGPLKSQAEKAYLFWRENFGASERIVKEIAI